MTGDLLDVVSRLRTVLPKRWFSDDSPNLSALLKSIATPWAWLYQSISYVICQTRLATATDDWLDLISHDYFGDILPRDSGESDSSYRPRIQRALLRESATRSAISSGLNTLVGSQPMIFEPANCMDTGSYGAFQDRSNLNGTGLAYGQAGGWGSLEIPLQFFVTVNRPPTPGISMLAGYGTPNAGYGEGTIGYVDLSVLPGQVTDLDIQTTLCRLLPVNAIAWLRIN